MVLATSDTLTNPGYPSPGKVSTRASVVASYTEMISHNAAIYDGRKLTLELVHSSERWAR